MKKKFYAIRNGRKPGIYNIWSEAEEQIKGFPNAEYKSFITLEEAKEYIMKKDDNSKEISDMSIENINRKIELEIQELKEEDVILTILMKKKSAVLEPFL